MTKLIGLLIVVCSVAAACGSEDTDATMPEPADVPSAAPDPDTAAAPDTAPATTTTVLEPVADRLPAHPEAPVTEWVAAAP